ncbi:NADPH-ferrihemo protein reductase [Scheffersomyces amazonensis]|uniref:NADPH-ferrihemo protein reductase n=1 Tax=Scheffersomyces amazonensis TaxID=1078765 RepID=UPI00315CCD20
MIQDSMNSEGVTILYGSETGNAEDYARFLGLRLQYYSISPTVCSLDDYPLKKLATHTKYLIIICSTTGQGELPRNAKKFMKFILKKKLPSDLLNHIYLTSFGLGDSSYSKFNYGSRKIHTRLLQLGCSELSPRCEADEMSPEGIDGYYQEWELQLIKSLRIHFPSLLEIDSEVQLPAQNAVKLNTTKSELKLSDKEVQDLSLTRLESDNNLVLGKIRDNIRITDESHFQDVRHIIIESQDLNYLPGDTIALYPSNDPQSVDLLLKSQPHWSQVADLPLNIDGILPNLNGGYISSEKLTLRNLFIHHLDIASVPRRSFFFKIWRFCNGQTEDGDRERSKLKDFSTMEESEELYNYANRPRRSILETILEFQENLKIPIEYIFDVFPLIQPRYFSIASRPSPNSVEIAVAIVEYKTILRRIRRGLCTRWLKLLQKDDSIILSIQKTNLSFTLRGKDTPPVIMIGPGTGIAPMKALIEHSIISETTRGLYLFTGFRFESKDFLFSELWLRLEEENKIHLFPSFSRDPESQSKYVQDRLFKEFELIGDLIYNQNAIVFVCGSSGKMPKQVKITFTEILKKYKALNDNEAQQYVLDMEDQGRYKEEVW